MIKEFKDKNYFLSNDFNSAVYYNKLIFRNAEAAFQAQKTNDVVAQREFTILTAAAARTKGKNLVLRRDWEEVKDKIMYEIIQNKFQNSTLRNWLLATGEDRILYGNRWHDTYWGVDINTEQGDNKLGQILMKVREEIRNGVNS